MPGVSMATDLLRKSRRNVSQSFETLKFNDFKDDTHKKKKKEQMSACISLARLPRMNLFVLDALRRNGCFEISFSARALGTH